MIKISDSAKGQAAAILCAVLFGTMPLMAKTAFALGSNSFTTVFGRFATGSVVAFLVVTFAPGLSLRVTKKQLLSCAFLSLFYGATPMLLYSSYQMLDSGLATTLHFSYPILVMILSALFLHAKIGKKEILCAGLCMVGILLFYGAGNGARSHLGMAVAALSGLTYALYVIFLEKCDLKELPVLTLSFWLTFFSCLVIFVVSLATGNLNLHLPLKVSGVYLALGIFTTVLAITLFQVGVFLCGSVKTSLLCTFEPVTSLVLGVLFLGEHLTLRTVLGVLCILAAVMWLIKTEE